MRPADFERLEEVRRFPEFLRLQFPERFRWRFLQPRHERIIRDPLRRNRLEPVRADHHADRIFGNVRECAGRAGQAFPQRREILFQRPHPLVGGAFQEFALPLARERAVLIEQAHTQRDERGRRKKEDHPEQDQEVAWRSQPCAQPCHVIGSFSPIPPRFDSGCVGDPQDCVKRR